MVIQPPQTDTIKNTSMQFLQYYWHGTDNDNGIISVFGFVSPIACSVFSFYLELLQHFSPFVPEKSPG